MDPPVHGICGLPDGFAPPDRPPEPFVARAMVVEGGGTRSLRVRGVKEGSKEGEGDLALFVRGDRVVAIDATCPHQVWRPPEPRPRNGDALTLTASFCWICKAPPKSLSEIMLLGLQGGKLELGAIEDLGRDGRVTCPRHGWCFDLADGRRLISAGVGFFWVKEGGGVFTFLKRYPWRVRCTELSWARWTLAPPHQTYRRGNL